MARVLPLTPSVWADYGVAVGSTIPDYVARAHDGSEADVRDLLRAAVDQAQGQAWLVVEPGGTMRGWAVADTAGMLGRTVAWLAAVYLRPGPGGRRLLRMLTATAETWAVAQGADRLVCFVRPTLTRTARREGWRVRSIFCEREV